MSDKNRNFRSIYYDKVGFRGVEEKKSLEILINEKPMDKEKLSKFCFRFTLPALYREYVWQVLLGVLSVHVDIHSSCHSQRFEQYKELKDALEIMRKITKDTPIPLVHTLIFLLNNGGLNFELEKQLASPQVQNITALSFFFHKICSSDMIAYFMLEKFVLQQRKNKLLLKSQKEHLESVLKQEDGVSQKSYMKDLLVRVFDKVIGGSSKILPFVAAAFLTVQRKKLLKLLILEDLIQNLDISKQFSETSDDLITVRDDVVLMLSERMVSKALDMLLS
ncbi:TBC1 domain family member 7 [Caerostris extrusa]|uniref:TBC1 domain family member 7 n=1 Tax=Caerostris extrusa TaxID=172846 RepID=A0AAV4X5J7_CAEEX|nr:TBC1 domain family member 7 [Caerostris extrusa]